MRTLYVHIGTPKTATTSIQMFCVENQKVLNKQSYSYPLLDFVYPHVAHRRNGHFLEAGFINRVVRKTWKKSRNCGKRDLL